MNFPRLSVAAVVLFALLFCLYTLLLKSPLGRGEPAFESSGRRPSKMSKGATLFLALAALLFFAACGFHHWLLFPFPPRGAAGVWPTVGGRAAPLL